jgi:hypothetical protein
VGCCRIRHVFLLGHPARSCEVIERLC